MNCRPGDLARIVGTDPRLGLNDRIVRLQDEPAVLLMGDWRWTLEEPIAIVLTGPGVIMETGERRERGERLVAFTFADSLLRPIGNPGDDAVDEMVQRVGPAPMTLTELLRSEETAQ